MTVDVLAIGAHPDDVEVGIGGIVRKLVNQGLCVGILDLTRGEMGTRGTVPDREREAAAAASILGVACRDNADLPDGGIANTPEQRTKVLACIRARKPRVILAPHSNDRHPDHEAAHYLVRDANYLAGLARMEPDSAPHRAPLIYYYRVYQDPDVPTMVVDVSNVFDVKQAALRAYASQFYNPEFAGAATYVSSQAFWEFIQTRAAYWGRRIGAAFGEPLYTEGPVGVQRLPGLEDVS